MSLLELMLDPCSSERADWRPGGLGEDGEVVVESVGGVVSGSG